MSKPISTSHSHQNPNILTDSKKPLNESMPLSVHIGLATLYLGANFDVLPNLGGVDACVTDPPYGLSFMGKDGTMKFPPKLAGKRPRPASRSIALKPHCARLAHAQGIPWTHAA